MYGRIEPTSFFPKCEPAPVAYLSVIGIQGTLAGTFPRLYAPTKLRRGVQPVQYLSPNARMIFRRRRNNHLHGGNWLFKLDRGSKENGRDSTSHPENRQESNSQSIWTLRGDDITFLILKMEKRILQVCAV